MVEYTHMILRLVLSEWLGGFLALPRWWYGRGWSMMTAWVARTVRDASRTFALGVWVRNLFVPMYGDDAWSGRLISIGIRSVMIVGRGMAVGLWSALALSAFALYALALPAAVLGVAYHGIGLILLT